MKAKSLHPRRGLKRLLPSTLFARSLLILIVPVIIIQSVAAVVFFDNHWSKITARLAYSVAGEIAMLSNAVVQEDNDARVEFLSRKVDEHLSLLVEYERGRQMDDFPAPDSLPFWEGFVSEILDRELAIQLDYPYAFHLDLDEKWVEVYVQLPAGLLSVTMPERRVFSSSSYIFLLWLLVTSMVFLLVAVLFMRGQARPIRRLAIAAERFGKGQDMPNFKLEGAREVRQAGEAFRKMHERLNRQISQRTTMLAGVSHDLRTPLTRLKLALSMIDDSDDVRDMKQDIAEMERMIGGYLGFVQGQTSEEKLSMDVAELLEKIVQNAVRAGGNVTLEVQQSGSVKLQPSAFERCLGNLLSNAQKFASEIRVRCDLDEEGDVLITIDDNGPGIPETEYEDVFRPFYRGDSARETASGSVGLGLPIAMDIVHAHGGDIWLDRSPMGGLRVSINIPR